MTKKGEPAFNMPIAKKTHAEISNRKNNGIHKRGRYPASSMKKKKKLLRNKMRSFRHMMKQYMCV